MSLRNAPPTFLLAVVLPACFAEPDTVDETGGTSTSTQAGTDVSSSSSAADETSSSSEGQGDSTSSGDSTSTGGSCGPFALDSEGEFAATDVAFVVDTSPSMQENASSVQGLMETLPMLVEAADDLHVAVVADLEGGPCVPPPLGIDDCADNSNIAAGYQRVDAGTSDPKADPLQVLLTSLDEGDVIVFRPNAQKHLVVMTDGDSGLGIPAVEAQLALLGPSYQYARVHAVAGGGGVGGCTPPTMLSAITDALNGETVNMCPLEGAGLVAALRKRPMCAFDIPDFPEGVDEAELLAVTLTGAGPDVELELFDDLVECFNNPNGVFIGGNRALLCRRTCATYQDAARNDNPGALRFDFSTCEPE